MQNETESIIGNLVPYMINPTWALSMAVFTELTDVEMEINGILTYDRQVMQSEKQTARQPILHAPAMIHRA